MIRIWRISLNDGTRCVMITAEPYDIDGMRAMLRGHFFDYKIVGFKPMG